MCKYYFEFIEFSSKVKNIRDIKGAQIYGTSLKLKNGLKYFNEIWNQQYSFIGVDYALHLI